MQSIDSKRERHTIASAIFFSLLIHFAAGALLVLGLSTNLISSSKLNGFNLIWVSLNNKNKNDIESGRAKQQSFAAERIVKRKANIETPSTETITAQIPAAMASSSVNNTALAKYGVTGGEARKPSGNINDGYGTNKNSDKTSDFNTMIAYPLYKENAPPVYPEIARVRGYEGIVLVFAEILPDGRVGEIKIRKSSGYAILDQSAIRAVKPWKFEPAKKSGNPFTAWVELPIKFILHNDNSQS